MNKTILSSAITIALGSASFAANASLTTSAVLEFDAGEVSCAAGLGTPPDNCTYGTVVKTGSYFAMDTNGDGFKLNERVALEMHDGIHIGVAQSASGSHFSAPFGAANDYTGTAPIQVGQTSDGQPIFQTDGNGNQVLQEVTEIPGIDEPWNFFGNTGMHFSTSPVTQTGTNGDGDHTLDFSGWRVTWNGIPAINMGGGDDAVISCSTSSCSASSTFSLDYTATVPLGDPSGFGGVDYLVHFEGHVVPVPAAAWLFGSGLLGLVGVARRRKSRT